MAQKKEEITVEYKEFVDVANELVDGDVARYPLTKRENRRDRFERHLIGMIEMYGMRHGDTETRLQVVNYLEKQIFGMTPQENDISTLPYATWLELRRAILSNEYQTEGEK